MISTLYYTMVFMNNLFKDILLLFKSRTGNTTFSFFIWEKTAPPCVEKTAPPRVKKQLRLAWRKQLRLAWRKQLRLAWRKQLRLRRKQLYLAGGNSSKPLGFLMRMCCHHISEKGRQHFET